MMMMIRQSFVTPEDCRANPDAIYLFGDNFLRKGKKGQAIIRDEPNAAGIATKWLPARNPEAYFSDMQLPAQRRMIAADFRKVFSARDSGKIIVLPLDGLGTGLANLPKNAPKTNEFLLWMLDLLESGRNPSWKSLLNTAA